METQNLITGKVRVCLVLLFVSTALLPQCLLAQKIWETRKGCLRAQGNLAPGYLFSQKFLAAYVTGEAEVFVDDRTALSGAVWVSFVTNRKDVAGVTANHALFTGINYHFLKPGRFDPFIGLSPGIGLAQAAFYDEENVLKRSRFAPIPLIGASAGCNYYVGWFFHFFVKVQGVAGQMFGDLPKPVRVDELKITAGLGWNIRAWKPKKRDVWKGQSVEN
jgi:hypothetical protein